MLSKEECLKALQMLDYPSNEWDIIEQLIKEHFELVEEYKDTRKELDCYYEMMSNTQPYKFEDLKAGMWVYSKEYERCFRIKKLRIYEYDTGGFYKGQKLLRVQTCKDGIWDDIPFEEDSFYPVQMANVGCE